MNLPYFEFETVHFQFLGHEEYNEELDSQQWSLTRLQADLVPCRWQSLSMHAISTVWVNKNITKSYKNI